MSDAMNPLAERKIGKVTRIIGDYGFISDDLFPDQDLYFKASWFRGTPPLAVGEAVCFEVKSYGSNRQAQQIARYPEATADTRARSHSTKRSLVGRNLLDWAYLGYLPNALAELRGLALGERWEFKNAPHDPERPLPILYGYLLHTFQRLALEQKVEVNEKASLAAFNTGLVDTRYEKIYALFSPNDEGRAAWQLAGFCIAGEGADGQNLVRHFNPLPAPAHYFETPSDWPATQNVIHVL